VAGVCLPQCGLPPSARGHVWLQQVAAVCLPSGQQRMGSLSLADDSCRLAGQDLGQRVRGWGGIWADESPLGWTREAGPSLAGEVTSKYRGQCPAPAEPCSRALDSAPLDCSSTGLGPCPAPVKA
jgi:hypothetical protein